MRFSFWPSAAADWVALLAVCRHAEATGWDGIWFADHFLPNRPDGQGPVAECWTTVAALAAVVPRVRIGTLVSGNTYRHPAVLAKMAATVDHVSGGRLVLGLGAAWQENEHRAYGIPFYTVGERLRRLDEACQVIKGLFRDERTTFHGQYYQLEDAPLEPKPVQNPLPLLIGGGGEKVTLRIAVHYADEWNVWGSPETMRHKGSVLDGHCRDAGRDPAEIQRSACAMLILVDDPAKAEEEKAKMAGRPVIAGTVEDVRRTVQEYIDAGVNELIIPDFNMGGGDRRIAAMDRFITEVAPEFR